MHHGFNVHSCLKSKVSCVAVCQSFSEASGHKALPRLPLEDQRAPGFWNDKGQLDAGNYTSNMDAFAKDMAHIFDNAFLYNASGSTVHGWAMTLKVSAVTFLTSLYPNSVTALAERRQAKESTEG